MKDIPLKDIWHLDSSVNPLEVDDVLLISFHLLVTQSDFTGSESFPAARSFIRTQIDREDFGYPFIECSKI